MQQTRFIFVTGGVMSGLGKGITTSSIGRLLISRGFNVSAMKIDPYINVDAGTMRPTEHGEVFVTKDGGEIDQDLGNYERFLHTTLTKDHNLTTGKIYSYLIDKERHGDFLGKTVQIIPHLTDEVQRRIVENGKGYDVLMIEIGGTVGDYENIPFLEAARQMRLKLGPENVIFVHVSYVPTPGALGEAKTKPTQHSVKALQECGVQPDFLVCRCENGIDDVRKEKLAMFCNVKSDSVISNPDLKSIYDLPSVFERQGLSEKLLVKMKLESNENNLCEWEEISEKMQSGKNSVKIGMIGKYLKTGTCTLTDSYISVNEAIKHACAELDAKPEITWFDSGDFEKNPESISELGAMDCVIVPGGFGNSGVEGKIMAAKYCRENKKPYLGLCYGLQIAVIEFARNVCALDAHTTEVNPDSKHKVIDIMPEQKLILDKGGTMRLGSYPAVLKAGTLTHSLYQEAGLIIDGMVEERHRHRYEVNPEYHEILEDNGLVISGASPDEVLVEYIELTEHPFFVGTQAHPEFTSWPGRPNPLFYGLVRAALNNSNP